MSMAWDFDEALEYYRKMGAPGEQSALVALLKEVQKAGNGGIEAYEVARICDYYGIKEGLILALIKRIPSLRLGKGHLLEICAGPNCGKTRAIADYADTLGGNFTVKYVPCMRMCGKGPNVRWDGKVQHGMTVEKLKKLIET